MAFYRKKPVVIEAIQFKRDNWEQVKTFAQGTINSINIERRLDGVATFTIATLEGMMLATEGDFIIKDPFDLKRGFYPCKPDIFEKTYEEVWD